MPAFLVQTPTGIFGITKFENANAVIVFASDATNARAVAKGAFSGDGDQIWDAATVTEVVAAADFATMELTISILDSVPVVDLTAKGGVIGAVTVAINAGGTGYTLNDILTAVGGTFTRAATFRVTGVTSGVIGNIELVDPGEYTVAPTLTANAVTGGTGTGATVDLTTATNAYENFMAEMVGLLNGQSIIAGAAIDMDASPPLLTVAAIADNIGDKDVVAEFKLGGAAISALLSTVVDKGIAGAVLTVDLVATPVIPKVLAKLDTR